MDDTKEDDWFFRFLDQGKGLVILAIILKATGSQDQGQKKSCVKLI